MNYWSKTVVLNPSYLLESLEAFNKNIGTWAPLLESDYTAVNQRSGTGDSKMFWGKNSYLWVL